MPLQPDTIADLRVLGFLRQPLPPVDARCIIMGLTICLSETEIAPWGEPFSSLEGTFANELRVRWTRRLWWGPKAAVVRRRDLARAQRLRWLYFERETIHLLGSPTPAALERNLLRLQDISLEERTLLGWGEWLDYQDRRFRISRSRRRR